MLDVEESMLDVGDASERRSAHRQPVRRRRPGTCDDLDEHPAVETVDEPACADVPGRGHPLGVAAAVPRAAATSAAATPRVGQHATAHFHDSVHPVMRVRRAGRGLALVLRAQPDRLTPFGCASRLEEWERPRSSSPPPTTRPSWARPSPATSASTTSAWRATRRPPRPAPRTCSRPGTRWRSSSSTPTRSRTSCTSSSAAPARPSRPRGG